ncbi:MAG: OmpA family protein [Thiobacillus sp.]
MPPKKIILVCLALFAVLSAATLAYYLPKLRGDAASAEPSPVSARETGHPKSDINAVITAQPPSYPDDPVDAPSPIEPVLVDSSAGESVVLPEAAVSLQPAATTTPTPQPAATPVTPQPASPPLLPAQASPSLLAILKNPLIQFETKSTQLTVSSQRYLDGLAVLLNRHGTFQLGIHGHTDSQNRLGKNQSLSETRARAVKQHLISKGVPARQLEARGFGGDHPIADNSTEQGRAKNRRIEFVLRP